MFWLPEGPLGSPRVPTVAPWVLKMTPRVPNVTPWVPKVPPGVPKVPPQGPPGLKKEPFWDPKVAPGALVVLVFASCSPPWFAILFPVVASPPRPTNPTTLRPNNPSIRLRYRKRAGGMRGAIE